MEWAWFALVLDSSAATVAASALTARPLLFALCIVENHLAVSVLTEEIPVHGRRGLPQ